MLKHNSEHCLVVTDNALKLFVLLTHILSVALGPYCIQSLECDADKINFLLLSISNLYKLCLPKETGMQIMFMNRTI
jgi:hypothetical protein